MKKKTHRDPKWSSMSLSLWPKIIDRKSTGIDWNAILKLICVNQQWCMCACVRACAVEFKQIQCWCMHNHWKMLSVTNGIETKCVICKLTNQYPFSSIQSEPISVSLINRFKCRWLLKSFIVRMRRILAWTRKLQAFALLHWLFDCCWNVGRLSPW